MKIEYQQITLELQFLPIAQRHNGPVERLPITFATTPIASTSSLQPGC
ncbi:MAG: hypothetical protein HC936_02445 [Leptolyngbyaceae cyanobacterium SU_3_3]|nr:hypothetical protein [Leptolyngbyaceae cyanobacterium SU_3_3]